MGREAAAAFADSLAATASGEGLKDETFTAMMERNREALRRSIAASGKPPVDEASQKNDSPAPAPAEAAAEAQSPNLAEQAQTSPPSAKGSPPPGGKKGKGDPSSPDGTAAVESPSATPPKAGKGSPTPGGKKGKATPAALPSGSEVDSRTEVESAATAEVASRQVEASLDATTVITREADGIVLPAPGKGLPAPGKGVPPAGGKKGLPAPGKGKALMSAESS